MSSQRGVAASATAAADDVAAGQEEDMNHVMELKPSKEFTVQRLRLKLEQAMTGKKEEAPDTQGGSSFIS